MAPSSPTGLTTTAYNNRVLIDWVQNSIADNVQGYNVYNSTTSGGGASGYVKLNNTLITTYNQIIDNVYWYEYIHQNITEKVVQYYVVTAVDNSGNESSTSIEIQATPLTIPVVLVQTTPRSQNDIALDYITELLQRDPLLDVKPGSVTRQLHVDPNSLEMSYAFIREDFNKRSQSFLYLRALDDSNGDNISDSVSASTYKQSLKTAFFYTTDLQVQDLIDSSFDALASNYSVIRLPATQATTNVIYYTNTAPTTNLSVGLNEIVSTTPTDTQVAISFITLSSGTMYVAQIQNYYNPVTQRYELTIPVQAVLAGSSGNVNANTIVNTNNSGFSVINPESAFGGRDEESNADLADRAQLSFVGLDVGTAYGYKKTCTSIPGVTDVIVVTAGDPLMQRDYDEVRKKHVYGKVDIYIKSGKNVQAIDHVGFLYKQVVNEQPVILDPVKMILKTSNPVVTSLVPIYSVSEIRNGTKAQNYDLLGNWQVTKNNVILTKTTQVTLHLPSGQISFINPLSTGDVIMANYQYKAFTDEVLINPATGGEVSFYLLNTPVNQRSYTVAKNSVPLADTIDYTLDLSTGHLLLTSGLVAGDIVTIVYQYIVTISNESVIASAVAGRTSATLANGNVLESILIGIDGMSLILNPQNTINQTIGMTSTDIIYISYRFRDSDPILLLTQPASSIISIVSSENEVLEPNINYTFDKVDDILLEGNSSKSNRTVQIIYANGMPSGDLRSTTENVVFINNEYTELSNYAIVLNTLVVQSGSITYLQNIDYLVMPETEGNKVKIARSINSSIPIGVAIQVTYDYGVILTITYDADTLVEKVQNVINTTRHVTADVLVKDVLETYVDLEIGVVQTATDKLTLTNNITAAISDKFNNLKLGQGIAQSDLIRVVEEVSNVRSVVVPLTKMVKANGTLINREQIASTFSIYQINNVVAYTTGPNALLNKTLGNVSANGFYSIFENDVALKLVTDPSQVDSAAGQGYISSSGEVIISTIASDEPSSHSYTVSYVVYGETGAKNIEITSLEFLSIGELLITIA